MLCPQTYGTTMIECDYPEGATPLDVDESEGLLLTHITTRGELDRWEQDNIVEALAWLAKAKPTDILKLLIRLTQHATRCRGWGLVSEGVDHPACVPVPNSSASYSSRYVGAAVAMPICRTR